MEERKKMTQEERNENLKNILIKKFDGTGMFPTDSQGKILYNRAKGYDPSVFSFERYKKTPQEKLELSLAKSRHKASIQK
jgi:hypothetical protein